MVRSQLFSPEDSKTIGEDDVYFRPATEEAGESGGAASEVVAAGMNVAAAPSRSKLLAPGIRDWPSRKFFAEDKSEERPYSTEASD
jgi:hypothetical protein